MGPTVGFSLGTPMPKLTAADMGVPNYMKALSEGMTLGMQPRKQSEELLASMLQNKIQGVNAQYADRLAQANLAHTNAGTSQIQQAMQAKALEMQQAKAFQDMIRNYQGNQNQGIQSGMPQNIGNISGNENSIQPVDQNLNDRMTSGFNQQPMQQPQAQVPSQPKSQGNIVNPGNPNLYHLDKMYNEQPQFRKRMEALGFKQTQDVKYDPKSGITTVITKNPSGQVSINTLGTQNPGGNMPLTTAAKTKFQIQKSAIPQLRQIIKQLKEAPSPAEPSIGFGLGNLYRPAARAKHHSLVNIGKDLFVKAKGINATDKTLETGEKVLDRQTLESDAAYGRRLDDFDKTLDEDEKHVNEALSQGIAVNSNKSKTPKVNNNNPDTWENGYGEIKDQLSGEWVRIPVNKGEWREFLADGGRRHG